MTSHDSLISAKLIQHDVRVYHAENLRNFRTYCRNKAVMCRNDLIENDPKFYTEFYSDSTDRKLGALGRFFGNIYDFGSVFSRAQDTVPNIYGPIMLIFRPEIFSSMSDICITKKSIASLRERWRESAIVSESEIDLLLSGDRYGSPINPSYHYSEISCANSRISLDFLEKIIVEPIAIHGIQLIDLVRETCDRSPIACPIIERGYRSLNNRNLLRDLVSICGSLPPAASQQGWSFDESKLPQGFSSYRPERKNHICLWIKYFFFGTFDEVHTDLLIDNADDDRTICELCDPGEDRPPAMVNYQPWSVGEESEPRIDLGRCDWCNGISVRCRGCGEITPVYEHEYDQPISCSGECGLYFRVQSYCDPRDGGGCEEIEILPDRDPNEENGILEH